MRHHRSFRPNELTHKKTMNIIPLDLSDVIVDPPQKTLHTLICDMSSIQITVTLPIDRITLMPIKKKLTTPTHFSAIDIGPNSTASGRNPTKNVVIATKSPRFTQIFDAT